MDNALKMLGLAKKAGRLEVGEEPVGAVARARKAKLLLLAQDAAENTVRRCAHFGQAGNVLFLTTPYTKAELGFAVGRTSCAMLAFTDPGFASSFVDKLAAQDPERYGSAAEQLQVKARKALERQKEQRQHEKNLAQGKRKPWAAPPKETVERKKESGKKPAAKQNSAGPVGKVFRPRSKQS